MGGYIKIDRKILDWEWWRDINTYRLFTYMLLKANWKPGEFNGIVIPRGSFVSSISRLSEETNLTVSEVRTALKHLLDTGEVSSVSNNKYTIYKVNNYCSYQNTENHINKNTVNSNNYDELISLSEKLIKKYWGRSWTEIDIENIEGLIVSFDGEEAAINHEKLKLLEYCLDKSVQAGAMNWNYVNGIIKRLRLRKISTLSDAYRYDIIRDMKKSGG